MSKALPWIAVVDDDPSVLKALDRLLRARGLQTKKFSSAAEFLGALRDGIPKCLILDLHMPEMDGLELYRQLTHQGLRIPTVVITALDDASAHERCKIAGIDAVLLKPLQDTSLFAAIDRACGAPWPDSDLSPK